MKALDSSRLSIQKSFRVTPDEHAVIQEIMKAQERREADVIRRIFRRGLELEQVVARGGRGRR